MKPFPFRAALACSALLLAGPASAAPQINPGIILERRFKQLDRDGDGKLSAVEAESIASLVEGADADKDGFLTPEEIRDFFRERIGRAIDSMRGPDAGAGLPAVTDAPPPPLLPDTASPREEPGRLPAAQSGIGRRMGDAALEDLDGKAVEVAGLLGGRPAVIALVSTSCPVGKRLLPSLGRLAQEYASKGVGMILVAPTMTDTPKELREALAAAGLKDRPCLRDPKNALLQQLGARSTTDTFLVDAARTLVYRGALDDQYGLGYSLEAPRQRYLARAIDALLAGRSPEIPATEAPGCVLDLAPPAAGGPAVTYHNRISRLIQANCQECHRTGGVAPFALETYEQVVAKSGMIRKMVERGLMPPWFAAPPAPGTHSPWANDRTLAERDKADLLGWLAAGKPAGDPKDAPAPRQFPSGWEIGQPDAVLQLPSPVAINAEGVMPYQIVTVETGFGEDKWVRGFEIQPTAREVVHHVLVFAQEPGRGRFAGERDERDGFFAAYVPGNTHVVFPDGFAKALPAGSRLRFQIHYTPNGTATKDQMKLGLLFAKEPPRHVIRVTGISDHRISIPPGAARHPESAVLPVPREVRVLGFTPHMHVRGTAFRYEAILPDGSIRTLLDVPRYDFNWQISYRYSQPLALPAGSKIRATGWFDNSPANPANPDPAKRVLWGPQTYDEMMLGYVEYYLPEEPPSQKTAVR